MSASTLTPAESRSRPSTNAATGLATGAEGSNPATGNHWSTVRQLLAGFRPSGAAVPSSASKRNTRPRLSARVGDDELGATAGRRTGPRPVRHLLDLAGVVERHPVIARDAHRRCGDHREDGDEHDHDHQLDKREAGLEPATVRRDGARAASAKPPSRLSVRVVKACTNRPLSKGRAPPRASLMPAFPEEGASGAWIICEATKKVRPWSY